MVREGKGLGGEKRKGSNVGWFRNTGMEKSMIGEGRKGEGRRVRVIVGKERRICILDRRRLRKSEMELVVTVDGRNDEERVHQC